MSDNKINKVVEVGNKLIDALRLETNYDSEDAFWELELEDIKWIDKEDLVNLTQLSHDFSNRCLDMEDEI